MDCSVKETIDGRECVEGIHGGDGGPDEEHYAKEEDGREEGVDLA